MNRWLYAPLFLSVTACNLHQELEGPPTSDAGTSGALADADPPEAAADDAGKKPPKMPATDSGAGDSSSGRPVSICTPQAMQGATHILVDGTEGYVDNVDDIALGPSEVYAFSSPFGLYGCPLLGGTVEELSPTGSLPSLIAAAVAPAGSVVSGTMSGASVMSVPLPSSLGSFLGLRGPAGGELTVTRGQIAVDGSDVFYWTPSQLVQASLAGAPDRLVANYTATTPNVTAMAFDSTYLYFATSDAVLHRTPRSGGAIDDLATLFEPVDAILVDGGTLYLTVKKVDGLGSADFTMRAYDMAAKTTTQEITLPLIIARTTPVVFDGSAFYWGASSGETDCGGVLLRLTKSAFLAQGPAETLVKHLDVPLVVRTSSGNAYIGTSDDATYRTPLTMGQLLLWTP